ncbi:hypothetical protein K493DRAFT_317880 [Basidiobolus meristosporus CBS 931.73]|uniref:Uncharacterized protein n=1 Tax=Basidiobolus meristosporus CBS 931.73 TaxID=1314790 RepID=A0A1Y1WQX8_9FUNG|nr:hypothetical protein K493DRAFT_321633 [Basidiobolus meristosporus CBS 931.73]ORX90573.1 hypothetical protein K493DRAFT_317880 [Basidiobolus meristosporus CBS 931.73]|eukprot:ORX75930.1 hypothetical protein K493DRAFT_321633 [Basidiobolus meristosporus CBS 931.73]
MTAVLSSANSPAKPAVTTRVRNTSPIRPGQIAFEIGLGENEQAIVRTHHQTYYTMTLKKGLFGSKVKVYDAIGKKELFVAKSRAALGYIQVHSPCFETRLQFSRPASKSGVYGFEVHGEKYFWDYLHNSHLRCFVASTKTLVAQFQYNFDEDCRKVGQLVLAEQATQPHIQPFLILTALLFLKPKIWCSE